MDSVIEVAEAVRRGERSAVEVMAESRELVERADPDLKAFVHLDWDMAESRAAEVDACVRNGGDPGPLAGVPFGAKDGDSVAGMPSRLGSVLYRDAEPKTVDDPHIRRLKGAGAIVVGKTTPSEFGFDQATRTKLSGITRNPWNLERTPGGSSGSSAAATAAGLIPFGTGSDAGGSIRDPAGFTGLVGHKVSHGRIARRMGGGDFNVYGVLTTTVADTARLIDVMAGPDPVDKMALPAPETSYERAIDEIDVEGLRVAWAPDLCGFAPCDPEVRQIAEEAAMELIAAAKLASCADVLRLTVNPSWVFRRMSSFSAYTMFTQMGHWPRDADQLWERTRASVEAGSRMSPADVSEFNSARSRLEQEVSQFFLDCDVLMTPTCACEAFPAEGPIPDTIDGKDASLGGSEPFGYLANLCWLPSISVPAGLTRAGLPVGLMITGPGHRDDLVLRLARLAELNRPWPRLAPAYDRRLDLLAG